MNCNLLIHKSLSPKMYPPPQQTLPIPNSPTPTVTEYITEALKEGNCSLVHLN